VIYLPHIRINL